MLVNKHCTLGNFTIFAQISTIRSLILLEVSEWLITTEKRDVIFKFSVLYSHLIILFWEIQDGFEMCFLDYS